MTNPFSSNIFVTIWSKHFNNAKPSLVFNFIDGVTFFKSLYLPFFINIGENLTKGIYYKLNSNFNDFKGKTFLVYDVPSYFNIETNDDRPHSLGLKKVFQYHGFLMDITDYNSYDDYINSQFSSKNRREFRANIRKIETCFNISYKFLFETINKVDYEEIFQHFFNLLSYRYNDKKMTFYLLKPHIWSYYKELVFEMINDKKASMLIIYNKKTPIGITLNFHSENILFETITVFDPDYYKFSIGKTSIIKLLEWCFENDYKMSDFSKGEFDYKQKWGNLKYDFEYHIFYDKTSMKSKVTASLIEKYFKLKLYLRERDFNVLYRKIEFLLSFKNKRNKHNIKVVNESVFQNDNQYDKIDLSHKNYAFLYKYVYTYLFANSQPFDEVEIYKSKLKNEFIISGNKNSQRLLILP